MDEILGRLQDFFSWERVSSYAVDTLIPTALIVVVVSTVFYALWRVVRRVAALALERSHLDETAGQFIQAMVRIVFLTVGLISVLSEVGVDTKALLTSLGVVGLTVGFAAKDTLSNVISGLFIFWDRPFVVGDLVEISGQYGHVKLITMRSTRVVTVDGKMLAIPNSVVVNTVVASYTNFPHLRLDIPVTVHVDEDLDRARALLLGLVVGDKRYLSEPAPACLVTALNDYNVELQLRVWIEDERQHIAMRAELRQKMFETLRSAKVDMPYQTFRVAPVAPLQIFQAAEAATSR